ncbi:MAG: nitrate reductase subunit alpha [Desulfurococcales archaeon]|nr:nitrate reductase subunit alpha [Desulfurococcales archaeon]
MAGRGVSRRDFLRIMAAIGAASAIGGVASVVARERYLSEIPFTRETYPEDFRGWESFYRDMWQYDKVARSTHGVNCTGSCSWFVYVKDGIVAWEIQATDYPEISSTLPLHDPRGCPRGASFSWYLYSSTRVKYPYVRKPLLEAWRRARAQHEDPVDAWASIVENPEVRKSYTGARGLGGWVRASWDEVLEIMAAALVYTIKKYGPDRIFGFTPIPAMSPVSYASGARFIELIGGSMGSFYDWYADLPPASPQIWGEQTDVPESADWFNAAYIINFGTNIPMTRTPDAHFFTEVRYRGTKIVVVSPDFSEHTRFADVWIPARAGSDGALALAMAHVILKEYYVERSVEFFIDYAKRFTDLPFLVVLEERNGRYRPGKFLRLSDLDASEYLDPRYGEEKLPEWKLLVLDSNTGSIRLVNGSIGFRWDDSGRWNLELKDPVTGDPVDPALTLIGEADEVVDVEFPYFGPFFTQSSWTARRVPAIRVATKSGEKLVTTVFDLLTAYLGVDRGLGGDYPSGYDDPKPFTPAWQEEITGVSRDLVVRIAREFAETAVKTQGRVMIMLGPGVNHWYHADLYYRGIIALVVLTGAQGRNGGGWAHYVGQEKIRTLVGWATIAFALDWVKPPRHQNSPSFYYIHTDQWRYDPMRVTYIAPEGSDIRGKIKCEHPADCNVIAARLGWLPFYPQFNRNPLDLAREAREKGKDPVDYVVELLKNGELKLAIEDPDAPENWVRVMFVWRANLLGSSSKGHEYFLKHLLGSPMQAVMSEELARGAVKEIVWRDPAPEAKLDLLVFIDFRMPTTGVYADIVLPAATWYEKYDLSMTDLHTFIHPFTPAVDPLWESKTDWEIFRELAKKFSEIASKHFNGPVEDIVARALWHDTPLEVAQEYGVVKDWRKGETEPIPGKTMWDLKVVKRDYRNVYNMFISLGGGARKVGAKGISYDTSDVYEELKLRNGSVYWEGCPDGCPSLEKDKYAAETILALSPETNGRLAPRAFASLEKRTGRAMQDLVTSLDEIRFDDIVRQPRRSHTSPIWSGIESPGRAYSPFTINTEKLVPWRTLSGRQHFYVDHDWFLELGEFFPTYKPPLDMVSLGSLKNTARKLGISRFDDYRVQVNGKKMLLLRYLTPHGKWNIHSEFWDNLRMLTLFRGGQVVWLNDEDARWAGISDNDWIEVVNDNGVIVARAATSPRIPKGVAIMYHAQERHLYVGRSSITGKKGGIHNSVTRTDLKPTKMVGGYAQLSYFFNYYGPTGVNRDTMVLVFLREKLGSLHGEG